MTELSTLVLTVPYPYDVSSSPLLLNGCASVCRIVLILGGSWVKTDWIVPMVGQAFELRLRRWVPQLRRGTVWEHS